MTKKIFVRAMALLALLAFLAVTPSCNPQSDGDYYSDDGDFYN